MTAPTYWAAMIENTRKAGDAVGRRLRGADGHRRPQVPHRQGQAPTRRAADWRATDSGWSPMPPHSAPMRRSRPCANRPMCWTTWRSAPRCRSMTANSTGVVEACQPGCVVIRVQRTQRKGLQHEARTRPDLSARRPAPGSADGGRPARPRLRRPPCRHDRLLVRAERRRHHAHAGRAGEASSRLAAVSASSPRSRRHRRSRTCRTSSCALPASSRSA